jgi:hypothetical protein
MVAYYEIEQGSSEWFELKHGKIGGTRAKLLYPKTDTLLIELLAESVEPYDEDAEKSYKSDAMENGSNLEPQARIELEKYCGVSFKECGWIQSDIDLVGISPDGISDCETIQCEIKCPQAKAHVKICLHDKIPNEYIAQCVHAFVANEKLEKLYFCSYRPENELKPLFVKLLTRESEVNIGTDAKPVLKSISDVVVMMKTEVSIIKEKISNSINQLKF